MTEQRKTITLGWRVQGAPSRRIDDFQEVATAPRPLQAIRPPAVERRGIGRRLENWGCWANLDSRGGGRGDCMTGVICDSMRRNAVGELHAPAYVNDRVDVPDAERINSAITQIDHAHRAVLQWTYVVCAKPWAVAGACGFPSREYNARLVDAQAAIEYAVEKSGGWKP